MLLTCPIKFSYEWDKILDCMDENLIILLNDLDFSRFSYII
jgi:hypothetical protein